MTTAAPTPPRRVKALRKDRRRRYVRACIRFDICPFCAGKGKVRTRPLWNVYARIAGAP